MREAYDLDGRGTLGVLEFYQLRPRRRTERMESPRRARGSRPGGGTRGRAALESMTVAQLKAYAQERGISLSGKTIKVDIIAAIKAAI